MLPSFGDVGAALAWGAVSSVGLVLGAVAGSFSRLPHHAIALAMSIGAGLLLATASLQLAAEAVRVAGPTPTVASLLLGAAVFSAANALLARFGAAHRKRCGECTPQAETMIPEAFHNSPRFSGFLAGIGFCVLLLVESATR